MLNPGTSVSFFFQNLAEALSLYISKCTRLCVTSACRFADTPDFEVRGEGAPVLLFFQDLAEALSLCTSKCTRVCATSVWHFADTPDF